MLLHQVVGQISADIRHRFTEDQLGIMKMAASCLPSSEAFLSKEIIEKCTKLFSLQMTESELDVLESFVKRQDIHQFQTLNDVFTIIDKNVFPLLHSVYHILLSVPQISYSVERLFSSATRIRSRMTTILKRHGVAVI